MNTRNLRLMYAHKILYDVYFWGAVAIPYLVYKGYSLEQAIFFIAAYAIMSLVMEIPTGIIGDTFGHRGSLIASGLLTGTGLLIMLFDKNLVLDFMGLALNAAGAASTSGSDVGLIRTISPDFSRDNRRFQYLKMFMLTLSFGLAGFVATLNFDYVIIGSALAAFASAIALALMKLPKASQKRSGSRLSVVKTISLSRSALHKMPAGYVVVGLIALSGGITANSKDLLSSFEGILSIDLRIVGLLIGATSLARALGVYLEKHLKFSLNVNLGLLILANLSAAIIGVNQILGIIMYMILVMVAEAVFYQVQFHLSKSAPDGTVASLISFAGFLRKIAVFGLGVLVSLTATPSLFPLFFVITTALYGAVYMLAASKLKIRLVPETD